MIKKKTKKKIYRSDEVCAIHNRYRIAILIMFVVFLFILHYYGVSHRVISDITDGKVKIVKNQSFFGILLMFGKWIVSVLAIWFGLRMGWDRIIKKKNGK